ncbi:hypothetical protein G4B88_018522 [Cannabis sativa]|uniref:HTH myb-type domain-containing protein n=1 Tax=Cannabis sativa TaxID=3483 RepID=A0A7J6HGE1_CANSA|nr:hypothetical protein G4B88_018522 [Cannabis sativa]
MTLNDDLGLSRCGKSCRLRWMNYLRPDVRRGNYTAEEENTIIKLHQQHGKNTTGKYCSSTDVGIVLHESLLSDHYEEYDTSFWTEPFVEDNKVFMPIQDDHQYYYSTTYFGDSEANNIASFYNLSLYNITDDQGMYLKLCPVLNRDENLCMDHLHIIF